MNKYERKILVIKTETLFKDFFFEGFLPADKFDFQQIILQNYQWEKRGIAEEEPALQQPIPYILLVNREKRLAFYYQRVQDKQKTGREQELNNKYAFAFGGHVEKEDQSDNPLLMAMKRELEEETGINKVNSVKLLGYLNSNHNPVSEVHFGLVYLLETDLEQVPRLCDEMSQGGLLPIEDLQKICNDDNCRVERWSEIIFEELMNCFD